MISLLLIIHLSSALPRTCVNNKDIILILGYNYNLFVNLPNYWIVLIIRQKMFS